MPQWAQAVIGPPGSGKTTYCKGMHDILQGMGRSVAIVNLDAANDRLPYECAVDVNELITLDEVSAVHGLGPNGGIMYCMEFLEANLDWLFEKLDALKDQYLLFDFPGQAELFTHHSSASNVLAALQKRDVRLAVVHLVDSHLCRDPGSFIAASLLALSSMVKLELPHVNVLSKVDTLGDGEDLDLDLDFYTEGSDLSKLVPFTLSKATLATDLMLRKKWFYEKHQKLHEELTGVLDSYGLVSYLPLAIEDDVLVRKVIEQVDKANGFYGAGGHRHG